MYLTKRKVTSEHGAANLSTRLSVKKYSWVEQSGRKWEGQPPAVEVLIDEQNAFFLRATLTANRYKSRLGTAQLQVNWRTSSTAKRLLTHFACVQAAFIESLYSEGVLC